MKNPKSERISSRMFWQTGAIIFLAMALGIVVMGIIFVLASIDKIIHPAAFAKGVNNYQILPDALINLTAIILPWLELILGIFLILGLWLPGAVLFSNILLVTFFAALVFNLARGLDIQCGCFITSQEATLNFCMCLYVIRDGVFLLLGLYLLFHIFLEKRKAVTTNPLF